MPEFVRVSQVVHDYSWSGSIVKTPTPQLLDNLLEGPDDF